VVTAEGRREDARVDERRQRFLDLSVRALGVAGRHGNVAEVDDRETVDDVDVQGGVVRPQQRRRAADRLGTEARPGAVARRGVEGNAVDGDVDAREVGDVRRAHERADPRKARDHLSIERFVMSL